MAQESSAFPPGIRYWWHLWPHHPNTADHQQRIILCFVLNWFAPYLTRYLKTMCPFSLMHLCFPACKECGSSKFIMRQNWSGIKSVVSISPILPQVQKSVPCLLLFPEMKYFFTIQWNHIIHYEQNFINTQPLITAILLHFTPYEEKFWTSFDMHVVYLIT